MFHSKTLLVVGAGASCELGFPVGAELAGEIAELLTPRPDTSSPSDRSAFLHRVEDAARQARRYQWSVEQHFGLKPVRLLARAEAIRQGITHVRSIDRFLDVTEADEERRILGKAAVVFRILDCERNSPLKQPRGETVPQVPQQLTHGTWYDELTSILTEDRLPRGLDQIFENVRIICFNYDRCLERYLVSALINTYGIDLENAEQLVFDTLEIRHPYGTVGKLPRYANPDDGVPFGAMPKPHRYNMLDLAEGILTFTEQQKDGALVDQMKNDVNWAETIVFLGFGFLRENLELIRPDDHENGKRIFGTTFGLSKANTAYIEESVLGPWLNPAAVNLLDATCAEFLKHYRLPISRA